MNLLDLATALRARIATHADRAAGIEIGAVYASNRMSDLLNHAGESTLIVTALGNQHLAHIAELLDAPGFCVAGRPEPDPDLLAAATERGLVLLVSPEPLDEVCRRVPPPCRVDRGVGV